MSGSRKTSEQRLSPDDVRNQMGAYGSGNASNNAGSAFQPLSAEESERQRMLDDLGLHRVEELPMEDEPRGNRGHDNRGRDNWGHDQRYHANPPRRAAAPPAQDAIATEMANVWRQAQEAGEFDDSDCEQVKDLSDLGGGRLYDRGRDSALRAFDRISGRSERHGPPAPRDHARYSLRPLQNGYVEHQQRARPRQPLNPHWDPQPRPGPTLGAPTTPGMGQLKATKKRRNQRPSPSPGPIPGQPRIAPQLNAREPNNTVLALNTLYRPSSPRYGGVWGRAYLTNHSTAGMRMLYIYTGGQHQATWLASRLNNVRTYQDNNLFGVQLTFSTSSGGQEDTYLEFQHSESRDLFVRTIEALRAGTFSPGLLSSAPSTERPAAGSEKHHAGLAVPSQPVARDPSPIHRPPLIRVHSPPRSIHNEEMEVDAFARAAGLQPTAAKIPAIKEGTNTVALSNQASDTIGETVTAPEAVDGRPAGPENGQPAELLIDIAGHQQHGMTDVTQPLPSQSSQLSESDLDSLAALQPYYGIVHTFETFLGRLSTAALTSRANEEFLLGVGEAFVIVHSEQHPDLDPDVIRSTVRDAIARRADLAQSASGQSSESLVQDAQEQATDHVVRVPREVIVEGNGSVPNGSQTKAPGDGHNDAGVRTALGETVEDRAQQAGAQTGEGRRRYSVEELLSMRHLASEPPAYLRGIEIPLRCPDRHPPPPQPKPEQVDAQVKKTANDMEWVMAGSPRARHAQPDVPELLEEVQPARSGARQRTVGLRASVWASALVDIDSDVSMEPMDDGLTEPAGGESPATYVDDLAHLQPPAVPAAPSRTTFEDDAAQHAHVPAATESPTPTRQLHTPGILRPSVLAPSEIDQTELSNRMKRLTIISPPRKPAAQKPSREAALASPPPQARPHPQMANPIGITPTLQTQLNGLPNTQPVPTQQATPTGPRCQHTVEQSSATPQAARPNGVVNTQVANPVIARLKGKGLAASRHAR
ncbi:hypothetical protein B0T14DRAFT_562753 [Immersiella caudata]|uniref:Uncharacterized protein n=1 Tax=Immersiella caudata TaxID=314043 RepID=A0AA40C650_9PEZI|nr:hypothetical protein B0T14DRAFT_562753 [Immersiella caudata]